MSINTKTENGKTERAHSSGLLPILNWLPNYEMSWLRTDILAGLTVLALLIPEGMAYAEIAGMPPQTAFYAAPNVSRLWRGN
jgi:MFS superfamily sulfate permease-like transporter